METAQLQTVVEKGFTNVLEVKTTKMSRGDCLEHVYAKKTILCNHNVNRLFGPYSIYII
jgi:hypothetical protein